MRSFGIRIPDNLLVGSVIHAAVKVLPAFQLECAAPWSNVLLALGCEAVRGHQHETRVNGREEFVPTVEMPLLEGASDLIDRSPFPRTSVRPTVLWIAGNSARFKSAEGHTVMLSRRRQDTATELFVDLGADDPRLMTRIVFSLFVNEVPGAAQRLAEAAGAVVLSEQMSRAKD